ncbi:YdcF family protein [Mesorhizobium sp. BAC0120]|uniref:YdcF family protein n=1 Tax=Mesorhizobium sp. BAC0120 TaxID=3090670 RepID=UPI00298D007E|nr:YdcF family protein [Mesorhizobium sp. BAC0120]MDW6022798.1 YdcF family protein [Mesorhizobium sp. BAC0120]
MFFYVSKTFWFFAQPFNLATFILAAGLVATFFGRKRLGALGSLIALLILALCAWTSAGALLLHPLEERFHRPAQLPEHVDGIVVLGGGLEGEINFVRGGYEMNSAGDRFVEAVLMAQRFPQAKILVSGGVGSVLTKAEADADTAVRFFSAFGIPRERLIIEDRSRNTAENAAFSKQMVNPKPEENWLLVTSAFHMPRSVGLFRKVGFPVIPWPADYSTTGQERFGLFVDDDPVHSLQLTTVAVREWIGLAGYWLAGYIDNIFPAPG